MKKEGALQTRKRKSKSGDSSTPSTSRARERKFERASSSTEKAQRSSNRRAGSAKADRELSTAAVAAATATYVSHADLYPVSSAAVTLPDQTYSNYYQWNTAATAGLMMVPNDQNYVYAATNYQTGLRPADNIQVHVMPVQDDETKAAARDLEAVDGDS